METMEVSLINILMDGPEAVSYTHLEKAGKVMAELVKYVDVCIANEEDASDVFGIRAADTDLTAGKVNKEGYKDVARQLADRFGFKKVAITLRGSISANDNNWAAMLFDGQNYYFSKNYLIPVSYTHLDVYKRQIGDYLTFEFSMIMQDREYLFEEENNVAVE